MMTGQGWENKMNIIWCLPQCQHWTDLQWWQDKAERTKWTLSGVYLSANTELTYNDDRTRLREQNEHYLVFTSVPTLNWLTMMTGQGWENKMNIIWCLPQCQHWTDLQWWQDKAERTKWTLSGVYLSANTEQTELVLHCHFVSQVTTAAVGSWKNPSNWILGGSYSSRIVNNNNNIYVSEC